MLKGIDVSSWNGWPFNVATEAGYKKSDFVIAKATQGTNYVNPYCDRAIQRAISDGKLFGFYHYAEGKDAKAEAQYFFENCKGYIGKGIPALDWESEQNPAFGSEQWCRAFVDEFHRLSGVWPIIYVQKSAISQIANCANDCGLWVASWGVSSPGSVYPWTDFTIWQWTSNNGSLDENYALLTKETWAKIAKGDSAEPVPAPTPTPTPTPSTVTLSEAVTKIAQEVINGKFGNGEERKNAIYNLIQKRVNELLRA